jgi:methylisocitrate lyase
LLKKLINDPEILIMPGVFDVISAKIAQKSGVKAVQASGYGLAGSYLGMPDMGIMTLTQMVDVTRNICKAIDIPVMADGDTGFGNAVNLYYAVKGFEEAGAAGINLEDQVFPKRCGHMQGKSIISMAEAVKKIEAAVAAKTDPDFVINARTDAIAVSGIEEAIKRGNAYAKAGADLIFVEAPEKEDDIKRVIQSIEAPVSINLLYGKKTPAVPIDKIASWGAARVSVPVAPLMAAAYAMEHAYRHIMEKREISELQSASYKFDEFTTLVGLPQVLEIEKKYLDTAELEARYNH